MTFVLLYNNIMFKIVPNAVVYGDVFQLPGIV